MMFEGKHIHFSPVDNKPLCSYSGKLCKQRRLNGYAFCIRHILEDNSAPFKQCAHVARYNNQKCTNPIPANEDRELCNSHMQVAGLLPKRERKIKKEKDKDLTMPTDGKLKFADRLRALLRKEGCALSIDDPTSSDDPYAFPDPCLEKNDLQSIYQPKLLCGTNHSLNNINCCSALDLNPDSSPDIGGNVSAVKSEQFTGTLHQPVVLPPLVQSASQANSQNVKTSQISEGKPKTHVPKFTKTMNRLQAKIAQNKLLDKLKKSQQDSSSHNNLNHSGGSGAKVCSGIGGVSVNSSTCMLDGSIGSPRVASPMEVQHNHINQDVRPQETLSSVNGNLTQVIPRSSKYTVSNNHSPVTVKTIPVKQSVEHPATAVIERPKPFVAPSVSSAVLKVCSADNKLVFPAALPLASKPSMLAGVTTVVNCAGGVSSVLLSKALAEKKREQTVQTKNKVEKKATRPSTPLLVVNVPTPDLPPTPPPPPAPPAPPQPPPAPSTFEPAPSPKQSTPAKSLKQDAVRLMVQQARRFCSEDQRKQKDDDDFFYGFVCSESEESESEEDCSTLHRLNWCSSLVQVATANAATSHNRTKPSTSSFLSYSRPSVRSSSCKGLKRATRASQLSSLKDDLRRYAQLSQKLLLLERHSLRHKLKDAQSFIQAVRINPDYAAQMLITKPAPSKGKKRFSSRDLEKTTCCHQSDGKTCTDTSLPYTRHCIKHITYNVDQLLFEHCTAKFADNTQCCVPVFDVSHELPLCWEHAKKRRESYTKLSSEPKPKKARKKTKPSALTRPPKRGKKKKKPSSSSSGSQSSGSSSIPAIRPETPPAQPLASTLEALNMDSATAPTNVVVTGSMAPLVDTTVMPTPSPTVMTGTVLSVNPVEEIPNPVIATVPVLTERREDLAPEYVTPVQDGNLHRMEEVVVAPHESTIQDAGTTTVPAPVITTITTASETNCNITNTTDTGGNTNTMAGVMSSDLVNNYLPGVQEFPLDTAELANQASKLLEEHDFTEVLNKIPDDAFSDLFSDGRNGEYIPTKEETEELERALAAVSKDVLSAKESLAKLTVTRQDIEELSNTIDISAATARLLGAATENLTVPTLDETALSELAAAHSSLEPISVITSDLNSFTRAFTAGLPRGNETLAAAANRHRCQQQQQQRQQEQHRRSVAANAHHHHNHHLLTSNALVGHPLTNGDAECLIHPQATEYSLGTQFLDSAISTGYGGATLMGNTLLSSASSVASIISTQQPIVTSASPVVTFNQHHPVVDIVGGNGDDTAAASMSSAVSSQWLLNPSLALTQLGYQNGFQVGPPMVSQPSVVSSSPHFLSTLGKFPLQTLSAELSLISSNHSGHAGAEEVTYEDSLLCSMLKDSVQQTYGVRPPPIQDTKPTILAQDGAS